MEKLQGRDVGIDLAKGIVIVLMVIGHCASADNSSNALQILIGAFHMPFFLIVSGMMYAGGA